MSLTVHCEPGPVTETSGLSSVPAINGPRSACDLPPGFDLKTPCSWAADAEMASDVPSRARACYCCLDQLHVLMTRQGCRRNW